MRLLLTVIIIVIVVATLSSWHLSHAAIVNTTPEISEEITTTSDYGDEDSTTTPTSSECVASSGDPGRCTTFTECYPLALSMTMMHLEETNVTIDLFSHSILTPLQEEILENLNSSSGLLCPNGTICCSMRSLQSDEILSDEAPTQSPLFYETSAFPKDCGRSALVNWRRGGASGGSLLWSSKGQKITGGRTALQGQFPFMVAIFGKNGKITCGATLITNDFVLTAAHCLATYTAPGIKQLKLHVGDHNLMSLKDGPHEVRRISQVIVHKRFNSQTYHNDVALIRMDRPVNFTERIQPICLPRADTNVKEVEGKAIIVTGWGRDRQWGYESSILRMVEMPVWKLEECHRIYNIFAPNRIQESMNFCAGDGKKNKDACIGDSGGPLLADQGNTAAASVSKHSANSSPLVQLGIVSWGKGCGSFPGVYTNLATFVPWIEKHIRSSPVLKMNN